jgi:hypothetical protein
MDEVGEPPLAPGACCDTVPCTCQDAPLDDVAATEQAGYLERDVDAWFARIGGRS